MAQPLILFATDRPGWCFGNIAKALTKQLSQFYAFKTMPHRHIHAEKCDVLVALCWEQALRVKGNTKCGAMIPVLYDHLSWSIDADAQAHFKLVLKNTTVLGCCNERIVKRVQELTPPELLPPIVLVEDGVDVELFKPLPLPKTFCCGWTGRSDRHTPGGPADLKGFAMVKEACGLAGVDLRVLDAACGGAWPLERMPLFYQDVSVQLIGSHYEGTPNPLLEALASGRPVITTDVGIAPKVIKQGQNGYIVARSAEEMAKGIIQAQARTPEMSNKARSSVAPAWSWQSKAKPWKEVLDLALRGHEMVRGRPNAAPVQLIPGGGARDIMSSNLPEATKYRGGDKPRVLLISDIRGWAFHTNMTDLASYLQDEFEFEHWFVADWQTDGRVPDFDRFDVVFCVYHRWRINDLLPWDRTVGSLRAFYFKPDKGLNPPGPEEYELVNRFRAFHVVTQVNYDQLKEHCPNVVYLTNPVSMNRFPEPTSVEGEIIASWNGNARHSGAGKLDVKGYHAIVVPACQAADVPLVSAELNTTRLSVEDMPAFYCKANVAVCASLYEGASNSLMEAMASGLAIIAPPVGNVPEMVEAQQKNFGDTGIMIVERSIEGLANGLAALKKDPARAKAMGALNRQEIIARWSWSAWRDRYASFLKKGL